MASTGSDAAAATSHNNNGSATTTTIASSSSAAAPNNNIPTPAARMITEDERRMKFLALLCGSGAFPSRSSSTSNNNMLHNFSGGGSVVLGAVNDINRQRSGSVSSIGKVMVDRNGVAKDSGSAMDIDIPNTNDSSAAGLNNVKNTTAVATAANTNGHHQPPYNDEPNYTPTTPHNLSRRILHKSSVGYLDESVPLLTSAISDRFMATVLIQAMVCRDRRIEGYKATLRQRKRRLRHRRRVLQERALRMAGNDEGDDNNGKLMKKIKMKGGEDYEKMVEDVDAEEEYYDSYFGKGEDNNGEEDGRDNKGGEGYNSEDDEDDDVSDDELIDESHYDLKLRDLVRPLSAWGFDLTGKMGFHNDNNDDLDHKLQGDEYDSASDGDDLDDEDDNNNDDGENEESDADLMTDEEGPASPKKKKKKPDQTKAKSKKATTTTKKKKATTSAKRKRDEKEGDGGGDGKDVKKDDSGKPKAKKAATESTKKAAATDKK
jgi:hypothetical protein